MSWRRPSAASDDSWTMEGFDALQALGRSRRKVRIGLVGSPAVAWLWADTISASRAFEAGRITPPVGGSGGARLFSFLWFYFSMGVEGLVGRTGLHIAFACLVAAMAGVALWGVLQRRDLDRRGVTTRALRHEQGVRSRWLNAAPSRAGELEGGHPRQGAWALSTLVGVLRLGWRLLPLASVALTVFFAWAALAR